MKYLFTFFALALLCHADVSAQVGPGRGRSGRISVPLETPPTPPATTAETLLGAVYSCDDTGRPVEETATAGETVYRGSEVDTKAVVEETPEPAYTEEARRYSTGGRVALRVTLGGGGRVSEVKVLRALPDGLTENAVEAACQIRFKPAVKEGRAVSQYVTVEFNFETDDFHLPPPGSRRPFGVPRPGVRPRRFPVSYAYASPWAWHASPFRTFPWGASCPVRLF